MNSTFQKQKAESGKQKWGTPAASELWAMAPVGARRFLDGLARMMRSGRRSKSPGVAQAALKWERALACFIKVRLIAERQKVERRMRRWE